MSPEQIASIRMRWQRLRVYRRRGTVLVDYRILRNLIHIYQMAGTRA
ncbi:YlcG family protein [Siccibacter colletis]|uniref:YlcG family protein n=1 Tax=Siccibacter colletis TaxID=1505757 RepID=A0ABY6J9K3_9ENTR|nr:YlcG family protein [Siccibacter colletis]UYU30521.1 YlcG family protein [Siccibacter colletis]